MLTQKSRDRHLKVSEQSTPQRKYLEHRTSQKSPNTITQRGLNQTIYQTTGHYNTVAGPNSLLKSIDQEKGRILKLSIYLIKLIGHQTKTINLPYKIVKRSRHFGQNQRETDSRHFANHLWQLFSNIGTQSLFWHLFIPKKPGKEYQIWKKTDDF